MSIKRELIIIIQTDMQRNRQIDNTILGFFGIIVHLHGNCLFLSQQARVICGTKGQEGKVIIFGNTSINIRGKIILKYKFMSKTYSEIW